MFDLLTALRTTGAVRDYLPVPVPDEVVARLLDTARFAPSGGNRQGWRVVVVQDPEKRRAMRDLYAATMHEYLAMRRVGLTPWGPLNDRAVEAEAIAQAEPRRDGFSQQFDEVPVMLAVFVDLGALAAVDRDLGRYQFAGGASVYPFCWNLLLAARAEGLAGVITTMNVRGEPAVKKLLGAPDDVGLAAVIALGMPVKQPTRLTRAEVADFASVDTFDGRAFGG